VQVGKDGITEGLVGATNAALLEHELIKVRVGEHGGDRHEVATGLASASKSELVGVVGRTVLLYRERAEEPTIKLPK
jgi:RNA-binding protein